MTSLEIDKLKQILTANQSHITKTRLQVFELLDYPEPQSMRQLLERAEGSLDRVSVYRTVELFEKLGIVHRVTIGWKYKLELTDAFGAHHHHLSCLGCGTVIDIADEQHIDEFIQQVSREFNFSATRHRFEIEGYCQQCR